MTVESSVPLVARDRADRKERALCRTVLTLIDPAPNIGLVADWGSRDDIDSMPRVGSRLRSSKTVVQLWTLSQAVPTDFALSQLLVTELVKN